jgi:hypothetical protein
VTVVCKNDEVSEERRRVLKSPGERMEVLEPRNVEAAERRGSGNAW